MEEHYISRELRARQLIDAFQAADIDKDGQLGKEDLTAYFEASGIPVSKVDEYLKKMDLTKNGYVSLGEYKMMHDLSAFSISSVRKIFEILDEDGSGDITEEEIQSIVKKGVAKELVKRILDFLKENDTDGNGKFDYDEFVAAIASLDI